MRVRKKEAEFIEGDLTPMIDMTFQLIAFFMVLINFSDAEQDQRINLPSSELAKPPDAPFEEPRYVQLTKDDTVLFAGEEIPIEKLEPILQREKSVLLRDPDKTTSMVTIIIRADSASKTGRVQELIEICQDVGFEKFALRAMAEVEE